MFDIIYSKQAVKFLKKLETALVLQILEKIDKLKDTPVMHDSKILEGYNERLFRVCVGDYRILYEIDHKDNIIGIVKINKRSRVY
ncbi:MAG: type II toxin-antitoxin system RelE/ParE family toxin [Candidatus Aenigmarchaeota archaeon]|nr:type II toxin-antitoxin system RelE/ParE family toxin [Candidatus Aenigmarchaeota archaeon]